MTKAQLLDAINFRFVDIWSAAVGEWVRVDRAEFVKLIQSTPDHRMYKAEIVGFVVRIG